MAMLHRIVMTVIEMPREIVVRFQRVFPKARLPDAATPFPLPADRDGG
jgi:hypothetical protein